MGDEEGNEKHTLSETEAAIIEMLKKNQVTTPPPAASDNNKMTTEAQSHPFWDTQVCGFEFFMVLCSQIIII